MALKLSASRARFLLKRFRERLWVKPLVVCLLSIGAAFVAGLADGTGLRHMVPVVTEDSVETLLSIMSASMLVIATFSVASMVSAYASAGSTATPRSFALIVADDASKNALSTFVGAFIFSIVALVAAKNDYFATAGLFILFVLTLLVFAVVIFTFVRWVDRVARLGRLASTIDRVEAATADAMRRRQQAPALGASPARAVPAGVPVFATRVGYVGHVDIEALQDWAQGAGARVIVAALPGTFAAPGRPLAFIDRPAGDASGSDRTAVSAAFDIGTYRLFDDDPRFGLVVLSEIAGRALSPAVNDPGTAIDIIGRLQRLFALWSEAPARAPADSPAYDRVEVPMLSTRDMFDDAFTSLARDGAGVVEVALRLQKALRSMMLVGDGALQDAARHHAGLALARSELALSLPADLALIREASTHALAPLASRPQGPPA